MVSTLTQWKNCKYKNSMEEQKIKKNNERTVNTKQFNERMVNTGTQQNNSKYKNSMEER